MIKNILISSAVSILLLSGCATNEGPEYDGKSYQQIKRFEVGRVIDKKPIVISDDGSGSFFGMIIGAVIGSTFGSGAGSVLSSLGGGIAGHYAGKEVAKADGAELTIELDSGEDIIIVIKGDDFEVGDKIQIIRSGGKVEQVRKVKAKSNVE